VKKGLKIFGEAGTEAVLVKEMKQLHDRGVIQPKLANETLWPHQGSGVHGWMQTADL
jgi:hypothetical protein